MRFRKLKFKKDVSTFVKKTKIEKNQNEKFKTLEFFEYFELLSVLSITSNFFFSQIKEILTWIERTYKFSRIFEFDNFNSFIFSILFQKLSIKLKKVGETIHYENHNNDSSFFQYSINTFLFERTNYEYALIVVARWIFSKISKIDWTCSIYFANWTFKQFVDNKSLKTNFDLSATQNRLVISFSIRIMCHKRHFWAKFFFSNFFFSNAKLFQRQKFFKTLIWIEYYRFSNFRKNFFWFNLNYFAQRVAVRILELFFSESIELTYFQQTIYSKNDFDETIFLNNSWYVSNQSFQ